MDNISDLDYLNKASYISRDKKIIFICMPLWMFNTDNNFQNTLFSHLCSKLNLKCINLKNEVVSSVDSYFTALDLIKNDEFRDYFKFTIIRNPWERLVSIYLNLRNYEVDNYLSKPAKFFDFKDWVIYTANISDILKTNTFYTHSNENKNLTNFIIRSEYFDADFKKFCDIKQISYKQINLNLLKNYRDYYDKDLIKYLNSFFKIDEINYGYKV